MLCWHVLQGASPVYLRCSEATSLLSLPYSTAVQSLGAFTVHAIQLLALCHTSEQNNAHVFISPFIFLDQQCPASAQRNKAELSDKPLR